MSDFSYIHVAYRGEMQGATRTLYSYTPEDSDIDPRWDHTMVEPAAAVKRFLNLTECYVLQQSPDGNYISLITRNTSDTERGYVMISLLVADGCALTGRQVLGVFTALKKAFIEEDKLSDEAVETALLEAGVPREPLRLEAWKYHASEHKEEPRNEAAYRTYISLQDLESIFSFPCQPEYAEYRCILVVSATTSLRPGVKMPRITVPIRKQYGVVCPEGVSASSSLVLDGDKLSLTYSKDGFNSHTETVIVGNPAPYIKYEGSTIMVRTAAQTGIRFIRRIPIKVISTKGTPLKGYTISVNGNSVSTVDPFIEFTERDLTPGGDVEIQVASNNFRPLKLKRSTADMLVTEELELELSPVEQGVTLRLDFGDGRVFEQEISIEKSTPEYNRLHAGYFHGFRANRQVTSDHSEVYNVDVRVGDSSTAAAYEKVKQDETKKTDSKRIEAPKFENISDEASDDNRPRIDTSVPVDSRSRNKSDERPEIVRPDIREEDDDDDFDDLRPSGRRKTIIWGAVALLVIVAVVVVTFLIPDGEEIGGSVDGQTELAVDSISGQAAPAPVAMTPEEAADVDYLNNNAAWVLAKLTSPMGQQLAQAITDGNLDALARNDYFAVTGRCTNKQAEQIVDMAWRAIGSPNERGNSRKLRQGVVNGSVVLHDLVNSLAKVRPSENPNSTPRPKK